MFLADSNYDKKSTNDLGPNPIQFSTSNAAPMRYVLHPATGEQDGAQLQVRECLFVFLRVMLVSPWPMQSFGNSTDFTVPQ